MAMLVRISVLVVLALVIGVGGLYVDHASAGVETFVVTKEADTNDGDCSVSDCSVREAFVAANLASPAGAGGGATVQIPAGTYFLQIPGADENLGATGDFDVLGDLTVTGAGPASTKLDGAALDRLVDVREGGSLNISGLTIQHGKVGPGLVAGLRADGPLVMSNVHVVNNQGDGTADDGTTGGVNVQDVGLITDSLIANNAVTGESTGGLVGSDTSNLIVRNTIIEGNSATGTFPIGGVALFGTALLENVTVRNNTASGDEPLAGMFAGNLSIVTIRNSEVLNNDTTGDLATGGIINRGQMEIWDTLVDGNDTGTDGTGGILSLMNSDNTSEITLRRVTVSNNTAGSGNIAGGMWLETPATLSEVTIDHNSVDDGIGGMKLFDADPVTLSRVKITNNAAGVEATGGLFIGGGSQVTVTDSWIDHNTTEGDSTGGVHVTSNSMLEMARVGITNNSSSAANSIGGIAVFDATASLLNVTVSGNTTVGESWAGVYTEGNTTINYSTISNNTAGNVDGVGGIAKFDGTLTVFNSIVGQNAGEDSCFGTAGASGGHNIDIGTTCGFNLGTDKPNTNPMLINLADNGGFSPTHAIAGNSPAVDWSGNCSLPEDQRISPRPMGSGCDTGAFEFGSVATTARDWGDLLCTNGPGPEDALALIADGAGFDVASLAGAACPGIGDATYVEGWFLEIDWGDFNCSGSVDIRDALAILQGVVEIGYLSEISCPDVGEGVQVG